VPGWANRHERCICAAFHHQINTAYSTAGRMQRRLDTARADIGIAIDGNSLSFGQVHRQYSLNVWTIMYRQKLLQRRSGRLFAQQLGESRIRESLQYRAQSIDPLRMAGTRIVL